MDFLLQSSQLFLEVFFTFLMDHQWNPYWSLLALDCWYDRRKQDKGEQGNDNGIF